MGLFSWLFDSNDVVHSSDNSLDTTPPVNCDGTPMIQGTYVDMEGKVYGQCDTNDLCSNDLFDSTNTFMDDPCSSFDDSFSSSFNDDW